MIYYGNPCAPAVVEAMAAGALGMIDTPHQGSADNKAAAHAAGVDWCADNGAFSDRWEAGHWWSWLTSQAPYADRARFAVAPDVVGDAWQTHLRAAPWLERIRSLGFPVAYVAQNGLEHLPVPWLDFDCLFLGGDDAWKLGPAARALVAEAKGHGKWVHMGRVNSRKRLQYAAAIGCDSADGTYLTFGADKNLPKLLAWLAELDQQKAIPA